MRDSVVLIEVLDADVIPAGLVPRTGGGRAFLSRTRNGFAARSAFPRRDRLDSVSRRATWIPLQFVRDGGPTRPFASGMLEVL